MTRVKSCATLSSGYLEHEVGVETLRRSRTAGEVPAAQHVKVGSGRPGDWDGEEMVKDCSLFLGRERDEQANT